MTLQRKITKIEPQVKRKHRRSIYLDGGFAFGLDQEVVLKFDLKEGDQLSESEIAKLLFQEEKKKAKERAIRLLAFRARSQREIEDRLRDAGYEGKIVEQVVSELKRMGLLDDAEFALTYSRSKMATKPMGEILLRRELWKMGIAEQLIDKAIQEAYQEKDQLQVARDLAEKRKERYKNLDGRKARKRIADFLLRRGFNWEVVSEILREWKF